MGAVYTATTEGAPLRVGVTTSQRTELLGRFYEPHHAALEAATQAVLDATGQCLIIDAHSFPSDPLPCDLDQNSVRPDVCIGTDPFHTPKQLAADAAAAFTAHGLDVAIDRPYSGAIVPTRWYRTDRRVTSVMVEISRRLYMDEATGEKSAEFPKALAVVRSVLATLIGEHSSMAGEARPARGGGSELR
jgi:N-formylglutamate amidohydrolase